MFFVIIALILPVSFGQECFDDGNEFCIDQNDILSVDLLPGSFLFADQPPTKNSTISATNATTDGSFDNALDEMEYHRKKMNEYLCHGYIAEEIINVVGSPRVKRRPDSSGKKNLHDFVADDNVTIHDKLLSDEGSSKYKNWLQRTTTLDDIYRHYAPHKKMRKKQGVQYEDSFEEFDGEVTGYAMQAPISSGKIGFYEGPPSGGSDHMMSSSGHNFHYGSPYGHSDEHYGHHTEVFPAIHEEHYYHQDHEEDYHRPIYHHKSKGHELSIRDFFEIALTALAFLAFGLFIIQLLMNATNNANATAGTIMTDPTGQRFKRTVEGLPLSYASNEDLNQLSYRVLRSIEAALIAEADTGNCLRRTLCEDNQHSKETGDARKIWVPVWSLGMSWISGRILKESQWSAMLNSVKASILGLGGADCASLYPDCDLGKERSKRRRRRRK